MLTKFAVTIEESNTYVIEVEAATRKEAEQIAETQFWDIYDPKIEAFGEDFVVGCISTDVRELNEVDAA